MLVEPVEVLAKRCERRLEDIEVLQTQDVILQEICLFKLHACEERCRLAFLLVVARRYEADEGDWAGDDAGGVRAPLTDGPLELAGEAEDFFVLFLESLELLVSRRVLRLHVVKQLEARLRIVVRKRLQLLVDLVDDVEGDVKHAGKVLDARVDGFRRPRTDMADVVLPVDILQMVDDERAVFVGEICIHVRRLVAVHRQEAREHQVVFDGVDVVRHADEEQHEACSSRPAARPCHTEREACLRIDTVGPVDVLLHAEEVVRIMLRRDDRHLIDNTVLVYVEVDGRACRFHLLLVLHETVNSLRHQPLVRCETLRHVLDLRVERLGRADEDVFVHTVREVERVVDGIDIELLVLFRGERIVLVLEDSARRIHLREEAVNHLLRRAEPVVVRVLHARLPALAIRVFLVRLDVERLVLLVVLQLARADAEVGVVVVPVILVDVVDV